MKPFVWVLVAGPGEREGEPVAMFSDAILPANLEVAWGYLADMHGKSPRELAERGYRVLRCKLIEVGPA